MNNRFCIGVGREAVAASFEFGAKFGKIVDLAIENNPRRSVFIEYGLMSAGKINNAEPTHPQANVPLRKKTFVIRSAVHNGVAHLADEGLLNSLRPVRANHACNPAHSVYVLNVSARLALESTTDY